VTPQSNKRRVIPKKEMSSTDFDPLGGSLRSPGKPRGGNLIPSSTVANEVPFRARNNNNTSPNAQQVLSAVAVQPQALGAQGMSALGQLQAGPSAAHSMSVMASVSSLMSAATAAVEASMGYHQSSLETAKPMRNAAKKKNGPAQPASSLPPLPPLSSNVGLSTAAAMTEVAEEAESTSLLVESDFVKRMLPIPDMSDLFSKTKATIDLVTNMAVEDVDVKAETVEQATDLMPISVEHVANGSVDANKSSTHKSDVSGREPVEDGMKLESLVSSTDGNGASLSASEANLRPRDKRRGNQGKQQPQVKAKSNLKENSHASLMNKANSYGDQLNVFGDDLQKIVFVKEKWNNWENDAAAPSHETATRIETNFPLKTCELDLPSHAGFFTYSDGSTQSKCIICQKHLTKKELEIRRGRPPFQFDDRCATTSSSSSSSSSSTRRRSPPVSPASPRRPASKASSTTSTLMWCVSTTARCPRLLVT